MVAAKAAAQSREREPALFMTGNHTIAPSLFRFVATLLINLAGRIFFLEPLGLSFCNEMFLARVRMRQPTRLTTPI